MTMLARMISILDKRLSRCAAELNDDLALCAAGDEGAYYLILSKIEKQRRNA
jgi:hypothetical protein